MRLDKITLTTVCESIRLRGSWASAARAADVSESTLYKWINDSKRAADARDEASPFYFSWCERDDFFHRHCIRAKSEGVMSLLYQVIDETRHGTEEVCFDPATGRPLLALDPAFIGVSDDEMRDQLLNPARDRYLWNADGTPCYQVKRTQLAGALRAKILAGVLPKTFGDKTSVAIEHSGQVIHKIQPPDFVSRHVAAAVSGDVIDAEFTDAPQLPPPAMEMRPDIEALRAQAAEILNRPGRVTKPQGPVKVYGRLEGDDADRVTTSSEASAPRPASEHARAYTRPAPAMAPAPRAPDGFPAGTSPVGRKAMKVG